MLGSSSLADQARRLKPVHAGHVDVEQNDREIVFQHVPQRLAPGVGADDVLVQILEDRLQREQLLRPVVDDQDAGLVVGITSGGEPCDVLTSLETTHRANPRFAPTYLYNHTRSSAKSCSVSTGLVM